MISILSLFAKQVRSLKANYPLNFSVFVGRKKPKKNQKTTKKELIHHLLQKVNKTDAFKSKLVILPTHLDSEFFKNLVLLQHYKG